MMTINNRRLIKDARKYFLKNSVTGSGVFIYRYTMNQSYNFYLLRTPCFSMNKLRILNETIDNAHILNDFDCLKSFFSDDLFVEAIYLASKDLYDILNQWLDGHLDDARKVFSLMLTLHKYYVRMCTRPVPYGTFALISNGVIDGNPTNIDYSSRKIIRRSRVDNGITGKIIAGLNSIPAVKRHVLFYPNDTILAIDGKYRYNEFKYKGNRREYSLSALSINSYIEVIYQAAKKGKTFDDLGAVLQSLNPRLDWKDIAVFLDGLIKNQFLISEIDIKPTLNSQIDYLIERLSSVSEIAETISVLKRIQIELINNQGISTYKNVEHLLQKIGWDLKGAIIQTDSYVSVPNTLNSSLCDEIVKTAEELSQVAPLYSMPALEEFKKDFIHKYENQEIPLLELMDPEIGIGYGLAKSGLIEDLPLLNKLQVPVLKNTAKGTSDAMDSFADMKIKQYYRSGAYELEITSDEIEILKKQYRNQSRATSSIIIGNLIGASAEAVDRGEYQFLAKRINTPHVTKIFGRFAVDDAVLTANLRKCAADEQAANPDLLMAELIHVPDDRLGNIIQRPVIREMEIPILSPSSLPEEGRIALTDLVVKIKNNRIILRSLSRDKEIFPHISNSLNATNTLAVYKFLQALQYQDLQSGFDWEWRIYENEPFLPRIKYKKFIVSRAQWFLGKLGTTELKQKDSDPASVINRLRISHNLPRFVVLQNFDNELILDLDTSFGIRHLYDSVKLQDTKILEYIGNQEDCIISDKNEKYFSELLIPVKGQQLQYSNPSGFRKTGFPQHSVGLQKNYPPGSDWIYFKIYMGNSTADRLLVRSINPIIENLITEGLIEKWFFIRYHDPYPHIRLRFFNAQNMSFWHAVVDAINNGIRVLTENRVINNYTLETYKPEYERYGTETMPLAESYFFRDSETALQVIATVDRFRSEELRWIACIYSVDQLLTDFGYSTITKVKLLESLYNSFFEEFNHAKTSKETKLEMSLNDKYRINRRLIGEVFDDLASSDGIAELKLIFLNRSNTTAMVIGELKNAISSCENYTQLLDSLVSSFIHMSLNRILLARQRNQELVIYHHLFKYYKTASILHNEQVRMPA
ncbi:lantibiotic dehydratase [Mucilaginibacter oryzae]|nr:lantibiotic dehydratase [Mucilaginibacter oryzae]